MDYFKWPMPKFKRSDFERILSFKPHHVRSLARIDSEYKSLNPKNVQIMEINCSCLDDEIAKVINEVSSLAYPTLLWLDPQLLMTECIAAVVNTWKDNSSATNKVALAITIPEGSTLQSKTGLFEPWKIRGSKHIYCDINDLNEPVWYPSLARDPGSLNDAAAILNPYDVFPLVEFSEFSIEWGEKMVTNHYSMLEQYRTRTRNFIYVDVSHPDRAFQQFYGTLKAIRLNGAAVFQPVLTPGGDASVFLATVIAGVLAEAYFLAPREEIPINSPKEAKGVMILRKCA
jgi:hypothetical protein